jgi:hypothetical protein
MSPIAGIVIILHPGMKLDYLKNCLQWNDEWIVTAKEYFLESGKLSVPVKPVASDSIETIKQSVGDIRKYLHEQEDKTTI